MFFSCNFTKRSLWYCKTEYCFRKVLQASVCYSWIFFSLSLSQSTCHSATWLPLTQEWVNVMFEVTDLLSEAIKAGKRLCGGVQMWMCSPVPDNVIPVSMGKITTWSLWFDHPVLRALYTERLNANAGQEENVAVLWVVAKKKWLKD